MIPRDDRTPKRDELVEVRFLEALRKRRPKDARILRALGDLYTRIGRFQEGLDVDIALSKLCPRESNVWYNLGCSYALLGDKESAFDVLARAIDLGYADIEWMSQDADLESLREDTRFAHLVYRIVAGTPEEHPEKEGP